MSALTSQPPHPGVLIRARVLAGGAVAALLGAAPHVLHHAGPLAGAALFAGAGGKVLFGALGLLASIPMLRRMHRRSGSWTAPGAALALFAAVFAVSTFVIGPAITSDDRDDTPAAPGQTVPAHESHHE